MTNPLGIKASRPYEDYRLMDNEYTVTNGNAELRKDYIQRIKAEGFFSLEEEDEGCGSGGCTCK
jgi:hypothetical protein